MEEFETKKERIARQNREGIKRFREKHKYKKFNVEFYGEEVNQILIPLNKMLDEEKMTRKEFLAKSYKEYVKRGGFTED